MFWSGLKPFWCILCNPEVILLEIFGFLSFLGPRSRRGPEPPRDENFEDSERIFKILEGNSLDFHRFPLNFEEFRDLGRFSVRRQARSLWISLKSYWFLLNSIEIYWYFLIFIDFERCGARGQPSAGPLIAIDFHRKNTIDLKKGSLKWPKPPGIISKYCKTMFWGRLNPFRCICAAQKPFCLEF